MIASRLMAATRGSPVKDNSGSVLDRAEPGQAKGTPVRRNAVRRFRNGKR